MSFHVIEAVRGIIETINVTNLLPEKQTPSYTSVTTHDASDTFTTSELLQAVIVVEDNTANKTFTMPLGTALTTDFTAYYGQAPKVNQTLTAYVINTSNKTVTIAGNTGFSVVSAATAHAADTSFYIVMRYTSTNVWTAYC